MRFAVALWAVLWVLVAPAAWPQTSDPRSRLLIETPECVVSQNGRADCLARDAQGRFVWQFHDGRRWSAPKHLIGEFAGPASCVVRGPLGLNCFAIRRDGTLWHLAMNGGRWRQWRPLGGRLAIGRPSCIAPARNQIACYARSASGSLAVKAWLGDSTWQAWREIGGELAGDPSCLRLTFERTACVWRRADRRLSGWFPAEVGPGSAILTLPNAFGTQSCAALDGDSVTCLSGGGDGPAIEWRGRAVLGGVGIDGIRPSPKGLAATPICRSRSGRTICSFSTSAGISGMIEATPQGWSSPVANGLIDVAAAGPCFVFDVARKSCFAITAKGALRAAFGEIGAPGADVFASAAPQIIEKPTAPEPVSAPAMTTPVTAQAPITTVSVREPIGAWRVFEPRTGLYCQITFFDAPAQPYRSLTRDKDCDAMTSLRGVDRWSQSDDGLFLRDKRGRVYFRFFEAGPTALRARWRRNDFIMLARDLRAFVPQPAPTPPAAAVTQTPGLAGLWRVRGPGRQNCQIRLSIDPDTAATRAEAQGCKGVLARADGWSFRRGALVIERRGEPVARFVEGRGAVWRGRRGLTMVKQ